MTSGKASWRRRNGDQRYRNARAKSQGTRQFNLLSTPGGDTEVSMDLEAIQPDDVHLLHARTIRRLIEKAGEPTEVPREYNVMGVGSTGRFDRKETSASTSV